MRSGILLIMATGRGDTTRRRVARCRLHSSSCRKRRPCLAVTLICTTRLHPTNHSGTTHSSTQRTLALAIKPQLHTRGQHMATVMVMDMVTLHCLHTLTRSMAPPMEHPTELPDAFWYTAV